MNFELHPACAAWPEMEPHELRDLADDIAVNGLRDPITLTPDDLLLDGRNRALACEMAGIEPTTTIFDGDPWLFSLSRNRHRRHMTVDQIAIVAAKLARCEHGGDRRSGDFKTSNEGLKVAEVAKAAGVPETAIDSAKVVLRDGAPEERHAVETGRAKLRKTADVVRARKRASVEPERSNYEPATPPAKKALVQSRDPIDDVTRELITKCAAPKAEWRTLDRMSSIIQRAKNAIKDALMRLGDAVKTRVGDKGDEYLIEGDRDDLLVRAGLMMTQPGHSAADPRDELASLRAENADLRKRLASADAEIERLKSLLHEKVIEEIAAKLTATGETRPTVDEVVATALG
jgi:hypothetical protein